MQNKQSFIAIRIILHTSIMMFALFLNMSTTLQSAEDSSQPESFIPLPEMRDLRLAATWESPVITGGISSTYVLGDDTLYVMTADNRLIALDIHDGITRWIYSLQNPLDYAPCVSSKYFYMTDHDLLICLDKQTGNVIWKSKLKFVPATSPAADDFSVYLGSWTNKLYSISNQTGKREWVYKTKGSITAGPTVFERTVFLGTDDKKLHAVKSEDGRLSWQFHTYKPVTSKVHIAKARDGEAYVYLAAQDNNLYVLKSSTGERVCIWRSNRPFGAPPALGHDGTIFQIDGAHNLMALHINKQYVQGKEKWETSERHVWRWRLEKTWDLASIEHFLCMGKARIYAKTMRGTIAAIEQSNGKVAWERAIAPSTNLLAHPTQQLFFLLTPDGTIIAIQES